MSQLPSELLIDVFRLACADGLHGVEQSLHLAQVCAYWRAVALDYPTFWAHIRVRTSRDAALLSTTLARSGDGALDVELCWRHGPDERTFSDAAEEAVVNALMAPTQRLRLKRFFVTPAAPVLHFALFRTGLNFPALEDLEFGKHFAFSSHLADRLDAPSLRRLFLSGLCLQSVNALNTPSLEHLCIWNAPFDKKDSLLTTILYKFTALRYLAWDVPASIFMPAMSDVMQGPLALRL